jgi:transcriptional regulator with XRE-family HTH domain
MNSVPVVPPVVVPLVINGAAVKRRREAMGMTQEQLAAALGVRKSNVSAWENGRSTPITGVFFLLCQVLEVEYPDELLQAPAELSTPKMGRPPKRKAGPRLRLRK